MNQQANVEAERRYQTAVADVSKLRGGNAVRQAAIKAADDRLRDDYRRVSQYGTAPAPADLPPAPGL
ncbi:hypothetical protein AB0K00_20565 [Dactylosporangium sp. NPDC049525]|uniref:hypothetical protein n=1 Tax=Dactylosporangium sp. NPDC049525 TaxID=3154730 RepID=UPI0034447CE9